MAGKHLFAAYSGGPDELGPPFFICSKAYPTFWPECFFNSFRIKNRFTEQIVFTGKKVADLAIPSDHCAL
jgi:hypothetical protein